MDLLASSGSSAPAAALTKTVGVWAGLRQFKVCINGHFAAFWALLGAATKYKDANARRTPACVLALRGRRGGHWEGDGGS
jgi:hypothetical protein